MIRTKGEAGTGNIIEAVRHQRMVTSTIRTLQNLSKNELEKLAETYCQSYIDATKTLTGRKVDENTLVFEDYSLKVIKKGIFEVLVETQKIQRLPIVNFAAGGIATPADAALMMQLGSDGVFVGSGIFKSDNPEQRAKAIVEAVANYNKPEIITEVSKNLGEAMVGINIDTIPKEEMLQERGW